MTLKIYIGTESEITARLAGAPNSTQTTVANATSTQVFTLTSATSFSAGDSIVIGKQKGVIDTLDGTTVTLEHALTETPEAGQLVRHYNADYTKYRDQSQPFTFVDEVRTGGRTGEAYGRDLVLFDYDALMPDIVAQNRVTIFESTDSETPLFAGIVVAADKVAISKNGSQLVYQWIIDAYGYQWEADSVGIEEQPFTNINAGKFINYLREKWTNLLVGSIDESDSPRLDYIRLSNVRRFSDVGLNISNVWPGSEFWIGNTHTGGAVYFRKLAQSFAPITLNQAYLEKIGNRSDQYVKIRKDFDKVFNVVTLPYYREKYREPDFHVQTTTADEAFLKTSVTLAGQPASVEESILLFDDFVDGDLAEIWQEYDKTNPSPPAGYTSNDGYLVEGSVNDVNGLHFLDTSGASPAILLGDIGRVTDPAETEPFTGAEGQEIRIPEMVISTAGDALVLGIVDLTTVSTWVRSGTNTSSSFRVYSIEGMSVGDRITVDSETSYISSFASTDYINVSPALSGTPATDTTVSLHPLALSRVKFAVYFKAGGDLKYIKDGVETAFSTPRTYTASPTTYSLRLFMQCFETTIASGISATGCTLTSASNFATGDVVEIFTSGSRSAPEKRVITVSGSNITYAATSFTPKVGYRVRTLPKMVLQIKGGAYGDITGRDWTTIYTADNTWQDSATTDKDDHGILLCQHKSLIGTIPQILMRDPPSIEAKIGSRYLHVGTQEVETSELDIDCIVRKAGSHYQLDFFPDTKALWSSGSTLELRYKERFRYHLESKDLDSMRAVAQQRGYTIPPTVSEQTLVKLGGRALDSIEISPTPLLDTEALYQGDEILKAVSTPAVTVEILTNTAIDPLCKAGQTIASRIEGIPDVVIERVEIQEIPGAQDAGGASVYRQRIIAGTVDRLTEILDRRAISSGKRIVIDDGVVEDSFTKVDKVTVREVATALDSISNYSGDAPTNQLYNGASFPLLKNLRICKSTGALLPTVITQQDVIFYTAVPWTNPDNLKLRNGQFATLESDGNFMSKFIVATGFGFSLPLNAKVFGFRFGVKIKSNRALSWPWRIIVSRLGLAQSGAIPLASSVYTLFPTATYRDRGQDIAGWDPNKNGNNIWTEEFYFSYGGSCELWGYPGISAADINDSGFGVAFSIAEQNRPSSSPPTLISADYLDFEVFYS